jgi:hypothetical protein
MQIHHRKWRHTSTRSRNPLGTWRRQELRWVFVADPSFLHFGASTSESHFAVELIWQQAAETIFDRPAAGRKGLQIKGILEYAYSAASCDFLYFLPAFGTSGGRYRR